MFWNLFSAYRICTTNGGFCIFLTCQFNATIHCNIWYYDVFVHTWRCILFILKNWDVRWSNFHFDLGRKTLSCTVRHSTWHLSLKSPSINNTYKHRTCRISCKLLHFTSTAIKLAQRGHLPTAYKYTLISFYFKSLCVNAFRLTNIFYGLWCLLWSLSPTCVQLSLCRWYQGATLRKV